MRGKRPIVARPPWPFLILSSVEANVCTMTEGAGRLEHASSQAKPGINTMCSKEQLTTMLSRSVAAFCVRGEGA